MTTQDIADYLGVTARTVRNYIYKQKLHTQQQKKHEWHFIRKSDFEEFLEKYEADLLDVVRVRK